jgi:cell division protein ZapA (FtsZ GTPase activity inhibitor)
VKRTIKIHVAGQQYILRSDADEGYVQSLADSVNARINALKGSRQVATQSDVVLAALKLADELAHERLLQTNLRTRTRAHVQRMLDQLTRFDSVAESAPATRTEAVAVAKGKSSGRPGRQSR